ncbi:rhamnogalacturonan acetylesterase [uncultured Sphingomonas sp.]|uniref:rhamnogalacturonan acetylesterase n=1 Tax=uncultured Sphingomonas sp. TaxID=158754 RepID=UPI0025F9C91A|nr:rhamnogalacturonan acetylesterase [uncultured Sphingomonas sp.]
MARRHRATVGLLVASLPLWLAGAAPHDLPPARVFIASDSTAQDYKPEKYPLSGWGSMLRCAFGPEVTIANHAMAGRSTKSFMAEGRLDAIARDLKPGDTLLIQFGHNDANQAKPERYAPIPEYEANLKRFIAVARAAKAQPVLLTPVTRRVFKDGHVIPSFPTYSDAAKRVAAEEQVPLIDLAALSERWIDQLGLDGSRVYYLHYAKGEGLPGYTDAVDDDTHFSELGARRIADLVANGLVQTHLPIARHILKDRPALTRTTPAGGPSCAG